MKTKILSISLIALTLFACKKTESVESAYASADYVVDSASVSDSIDRKSVV